MTIENVNMKLIKSQKFPFVGIVIAAAALVVSFAGGPVAFASGCVGGSCTF
jgi:hypothetical protein